MVFLCLNSNSHAVKCQVRTVAYRTHNLAFVTSLISFLLLFPLISDPNAIGFLVLNTRNTLASGPLHLYSWDNFALSSSMVYSPTLDFSLKFQLLGDTILDHAILQLYQPYYLSTLNWHITPLILFHFLYSV